MQDLEQDCSESVSIAAMCRKKLLAERPLHRGDKKDEAQQTGLPNSAHSPLATPQGPGI
jgi:hypothetical protein